MTEKELNLVKIVSMFALSYMKVYISFFGGESIRKMKEWILNPFLLGFETQAL